MPRTFALCFEIYIINNLKIKKMKKVLILSSLFVAVCFVAVTMSVAKRNASVSLQMENMEALTYPTSVGIASCYMNVPLVTGTGVFIWKCNPSTNNNRIYPCPGASVSTAGVRVESQQSSASGSQICYLSPD
jgi:hypothetical protein